ncbi:MAG: hypothetical protein JSU70_14055 [Phycisphaerales bacterium]|nr:MAG: hypothetical protein JSU70_14055 [Phycisphaerales bacterium]
MITISGTLSKGWISQALGVRFDRDYYFDPSRRHAVDCMCNKHAAERFPGMALFYSESNLGQVNYWDQSQIQIGGIQPNMILGMLLGADFLPADDRDADITANCLAGKDPAELPAPESLLGHELIRLFDEQIARIQNDTRWELRPGPHSHRIADGPRPIPPFFWDTSGWAAIHGAMTSAQKFYGETIFLDIKTEPKTCLQMMQWIAEAFVVLCRHFSDVADLPITSVHVGECSSCMVGPELVESFVVPAASKIGQELGPIRLHSCGPSTRLLEAFSKIANLHSLDLGGETSIRKAREIFGQEMQISVAPLPDHMSADSTGPILAWAKQMLEDNSGGDLQYVYHFEHSYNIDTVRALTDFAKSQPDFQALQPGGR